MVQQKIGIFIPVENNEMMISSKVLLIKKELANAGLKNYVLTVVDNGSIDRTSEVAQKSEARVIRYSSKSSIGNIINNLKKRVEREKIDIIVIIDGNTSIDARSIIELIGSFLHTQNKSGMGYISESRNGEIVDVNCLIFVKDVFKEFTVAKPRIGNDTDLLSFGESLGLAVEKRKKISSDKKDGQLIRIPLKSTSDLMNQYKKTYPLRYYGGISMAFFIFAIIPGAILFSYYIRYSNLDYLSLILTVILGGIGFVSLSLGLIMNALNVLSDKVRGMM